MVSKRYKTEEYRTRQLFNFFQIQESKGNSLTRQKHLREWAKNNHMSPTMLHHLLKRLCRLGFVVKEKSQDGVYYGLSSRFRDWYIHEIWLLEKNARIIGKLPKKERKKALEELIISTMLKFLEFTPFLIHYALTNEDKTSSLQEKLKTYWQWALAPFIFVTVQACLLNKEDASKILSIKEKDEDFQKYLRSNYLKRMREDGII